MAENTFTCYHCGQTKTHNDGLTMGYGVMSKDNRIGYPEGAKVCFDCCAILDKADMMATKRAALYLDWAKKKVTNWPGTLAFPCAGKKGRHNWGLNRYDVWFRVGDTFWWGYTIGDFTQICHCKQITKEAYYRSN